MRREASKLMRDFQQQTAFGRPTLVAGIIIALVIALAVAGGILSAYIAVG